ncbi:MAG: alpha/beta hydrolase [Euzebyales bacterium]|nr:alpha/beta hydrolase [Euzebyales bacterium]
MRLSRAAWLPAATAAAAAGAWLARHRASPAVQAWRPGGGRRLRAGPLAVRVIGDDGPATVLLHGLTGSGDWWGADFDRLADGCRLVIPDLLGFGASMDLERTDFSLDAHVAALDAMAAEFGIDEVPLVVVGHSMGSVLALEWAAHRANTTRTVTFCAPLYDDEAEAREHIGGMGVLEKLFALDSPLAERTCALMCQFRSLAQWLAVAISPEWPVRLSRDGVLHTWPSYLGGMNAIILNGPWRKALATLDERGVPVVLADGAHDPVPVTGRSAALEQEFGVVHTALHPTAGHDLPVSYSDWTLALVTGDS